MDAAVSSKPIFVYDTRQPIEFDNMQVAPFDKLQQVIDTSNDIGRLSEFSYELKSVYAESVDDQFYKQFAKLLRSRWHPKIDLFTAASASLSRQAIENTRARVATEATSAASIADLQTQGTKLTIQMDRRESELTQRIEQLSDELKATSARLAQIWQENTAIINSSSWRLTKLLRNIIGALRTKNAQK